MSEDVAQEISDDDLLTLDEFALLPENAEQIGATGPLPTVARLDDGPISMLKWGIAAPEVVFLHGGGQNAHTWDTVILGLGVPALAIDLPGHGRSAWREDGDYGPKLNASTVAPVIRAHAPEARLVVGMSLGGLTALRIALANTARPPLLVVGSIDEIKNSRDRAILLTRLVALGEQQTVITSSSNPIPDGFGLAGQITVDHLERAELVPGRHEKGNA